MIVEHLRRLHNSMPTSGTIVDAEMTEWLNRVEEVLLEYQMCIDEEHRNV